MPLPAIFIAEPPLKMGRISCLERAPSDAACKRALSFIYFFVNLYQYKTVGVFL